VQSIIKLVPVGRSMRKDSLRLISAPILSIAPPLVSPGKHRVEIPTLMRRTHPVQNPLFIQRFERRVPVAHDCLANVVEAMVAVDGHFFLGHRGDGLGVIRVAEEIETVKLVEHGDTVDV